MLGGALNTPSTESYLGREQGPKPHLHHLNTALVFLRLVKILLLNSIPTVDELYSISYSSRGFHLFSVSWYQQSLPSSD